MHIQTNFRKNGFSSDISLEYINPKKRIYRLSTVLFPQQRFEDNQAISEVVAYKIWFSQVDLPSFTDKFVNEITLTQNLAMIQFDDLKACKIIYFLYSNASDIKEVK